MPPIGASTPEPGTPRNNPDRATEKPDAKAIGWDIPTGASRMSYESRGIDDNFQLAAAMFEERRLLMRVLNLGYRAFNKALSLLLRYA
jgi:hypothetical protein